MVLSDVQLYAYSRATLNVCPCCVCVCVCVYYRTRGVGIKGYLSFMVLSDMQHNFYGYNTINIALDSIRL